MDKSMLQHALELSHEFDPTKGPKRSGPNESNLNIYLTYWARILVKYALFTTPPARHDSPQAMNVIEKFRNLIKSEIADSVASLSAPHGVLRCLELPGLRGYRYLGFSHDIADYGIPMLVKNDVFESHIRPMMGVGAMCNVELAL